MERECLTEHGDGLIGLVFWTAKKLPDGVFID